VRTYTQLQLIPLGGAGYFTSNLNASQYAQ